MSKRDRNISVQLVRRSRRDRRRGMVLLVVLVVIMLLAFAGYAFSMFMLSQYEAAQESGRQIQARALVDSGVELVRARLAADRAALSEQGGDYDNPDVFRGRVIIPDDHAHFQGRVTVLAPLASDEKIASHVRFGLEDESSRVNINMLAAIDRALTGSTKSETVSRDLLMGLPGMNEDVADAILDWIDEDDDPRPFGAEADHYAALNPPYAPRNGSLSTVEELLLVRGVTPQLLFGLDTNHNGVIDQAEQAATKAGDVTPGSIRGWAAFLTVHSKEANVTPRGEPRIYLNADNLDDLNEQLRLALSEEWAAFIVAYRQHGPLGEESQAVPLGGRSVDLEIQAKFEITQVLDLVDAKVRAQFADEDDADMTGILASPIQHDDYALLPELLDHVTVIPQRTISGRINVNRAPREILLSLPGVDEQIVSDILSARQPDRGAAPPARQHAEWLLVEGLVNIDQMRALAPLLNGGGDVYRAQVVGYFDDGSSWSRGEVIVDSTTTPPRTLLWRDKSHLGRGYPLQVLR